MIISTPGPFGFIGLHIAMNSISCPQHSCSKGFLLHSTISVVRIVVLLRLQGHSLLHHGLHHRLQGNLCFPCSSVGPHQWETVLLELVQCGSLPRAAAVHKLIQCGSLVEVLSANLLQHGLVTGSQPP